MCSVGFIETKRLKMSKIKKHPIWTCTYIHNSGSWAVADFNNCSMVFFFIYFSHYASEINT